MPVSLSPKEAVQFSVYSEVTAHVGAEMHPKEAAAYGHFLYTLICIVDSEYLFDRRGRLFVANTTPIVNEWLKTHDISDRNEYLSRYISGLERQLAKAHAALDPNNGPRYSEQIEELGETVDALLFDTALSEYPDEQLLLEALDGRQYLLFMLHSILMLVTKHRNNMDELILEELKSMQTYRNYRDFCNKQHVRVVQPERANEQGEDGEDPAFREQTIITTTHLDDETLLEYIAQIRAYVEMGDVMQIDFGERSTEIEIHHKRTELRKALATDGVLPPQQELERLAELLPDVELAEIPGLLDLYVTLGERKDNLSRAQQLLFNGVITAILQTSLEQLGRLHEAEEILQQITEHSFYQEAAAAGVVTPEELPELIQTAQTMFIRAIQWAELHSWEE